LGIVESKDSVLAKKLNGVSLPYYDNYSDSKIHSWFENIFKQNSEINKLVIPVRLGYEDNDYTGLRVGLHVRLTKSLGAKRFLPIIFFSSETKNDVLANQFENDKLKSGILLFTPGTTLEDPFN